MLENYTQEESFEASDALNFILDEETPCTGCEYRKRCADELLACHAFARYVQTGNVSRIAVGSDEPTATYYRRIFNRHESDDSMD